jgi:GNAT superfamily N-acetyltransferase
MQSNDLERLPHIPDVTFRLGRGEEDAPAYVTLLHACQSIDGIDAFSTLEGLPTVEEDYQEFLHLITPDPALLVVIWHDRQPVAITDGRIAQDMGIVDDVVVSPAYKRRGLAQAMLTECLFLMREWGVKRIRLHTDASNRHGARSLYEKLGFRVVKLFPRYRKPMGI